MNETTVPVVPAIVLRRTYAAPRARVFEAWTTPEIAAKFFGPGEVKATIRELNARVGGSYKIEMLLPDGERVIAFGTYREVIPPARLAMSWTWEEDDPAEQYETLLTVDFNEVAGGTELVLTHANLKTVESRNDHESGWTQIVDQLAGVL